MLARLTFLRFSFFTAALLAASAVASAVASVANAGNPSGMLLGVYAFENWQGLRVTDTIPGYSAHGRLFANDVLLQATTDGVDVYCIKTMDEIEWAKDQIGPSTPAAIEFYRPGVGLTYAWVEFQPIGGGVMAYSQEGVAIMAQPQLKAKFFLESEKPGAKLLFQGGKVGLPKPMPNPMPKPMPFPKAPPVVKPFPMPKPDLDIKFPKPQVDPKPFPKPGPVIKLPINNAKLNPGDLFKN